LAARPPEASISRYARSRSSRSGCGSAPEEEGEELDRLEPRGEIVKLAREPARGTAGEVGRLVGGTQEQQHAGQAVSRLGTRGRLLCDLVRGAKMLRRSRQRGHRFGPCELEQQLQVQLRLRRLVQRPSQRRDRRVGVALGNRRIGRRPKRVDDPALAPRRHRQEVRGDLFLRGAKRDKHRGRPLVLQLALPWRQVVVDGRLHEWVHEAERWLGSKDLGAHQLSCRGGDPRRLELRKLGDNGDLDPVAEHGDRPRDLNGVRRQPGKTEQHRSRRGLRPKLGDQVDVGRVGRHTIRDERFQEFIEQERVAVGRGVAGFGEDGLDALAQSVADDFRRRRCRQRPGHEHLCVRLADQLFQDRMIGLGLRRSQACHQHDREVLQAPRQIREKPQRTAIAPMEIVHRQQQRALGADVDGQPEEPMQHREGTLAGRRARLPRVMPEHGRRRLSGAREQP
jgi:hypothetical protein